MNFNDTEPGNSGLPDSSGTEGGGFLSLLSGLAGKAANSYIDSAFPTGNQNAKAVDNTKNSDKQNTALATASKPLDYKPYLIGGGIILGVVLVIVAVKKL